MPFTPFHLGPALLLGLVFSSIFDLPTLLIASVVPDVEPFGIILFHLSGPLHGFFHSYLGSSILAILVAILVYFFRENLTELMLRFKISQKSSFRKILFTSLIGVYSHVFLDSFLYAEMKPFYPLQGNPFAIVSSLHVIYLTIYGFCSLSFIVGVILYLYKIRKGITVLD